MYRMSIPPISGIDRDELDEWFESLIDAIDRHGADKVDMLLDELHASVHAHGAEKTPAFTTRYINTIPVDRQPEFPGDRRIEQSIKHMVRWNAVATVVRANRHNPGLGGHISTFASSATVLDVAFNHFLHARSDDHPGDLVYFQGHGSPGIYARAFLEGRLTEHDLERFRRETPRETGLSSYPHPWLMPNFWQFPTVSMGLAPIMSVYQARMLRYLHARGFADTSKARVWAFLGDGEMDEPESTAGLNIAAHDQLDNLIYVINCNLQRLDGPVRGNGKIIQELEGLFRGAGWNCIKVVWGSEWDPLLAADEHGLLVQRMDEVVDGQWQKFAVEDGAYMREHFFGTSPELKKLVEHLSDDDLKKLNRGGHDPAKVYAAFDAAVKNEGSPTVVLVKTIKGYGLGDAGEALNIAHQQKSMDEEQLRRFRDRFDMKVPEEVIKTVDFYRPPEDSEEIQYLQARRKSLGGYLPARHEEAERLDVPELDRFEPILKGSGKMDASTTMAFARMLGIMLKDQGIGRRIVPIIPDEARTFGIDPLFRQCGIYQPLGQQYEPVDKSQLMYYREAKDGQILEEGISEAGAMSSFIAAGLSYSNSAQELIPFYVYYSMFGFQRIGDLVWAGSDARVKGFMLGATAGRTTLNGEGLQHQDGHSLLLASTVPRLVSYDPAYGYELAVIIQDGMRRMYAEGESIFYYLNLYNENYPLPPMPDDAREGILKGMYRVASKEAGGKTRAQLFGSGSILMQAARAQEILAERFGVSSDLWSVTSYNELRREARGVDHWNVLHPAEPRRVSYVEHALDGVEGPFIAASDHVTGIPNMIRKWVPGPYHILGTDGFGRSDTRPALRRHFEVDAECIAYRTLYALAEMGRFDRNRLADALVQLEIDPDKIDPATA